MINLLSIICVSGAIFLMWEGKKGWGWLIFIAILAGHTFGNKNEH